MDGNVGLEFFLRTLGFQSLTLLVQFFGLVLALVFIRRCPIASVLTMIAIILSIGATVGLTALQAFFVQMSSEGEIDPAEMSKWMTVVGVAGGALRSLGLGCLLAAVFVERPHRHKSD